MRYNLKNGVNENLQVEGPCCINNSVLFLTFCKPFCHVNALCARGDVKIIHVGTLFCHVNYQFVRVDVFFARVNALF